jgi:phosphoglycerol transferase MdoB-like AlkP superfamily enzyme
MESAFTAKTPVYGIALLYLTASNVPVLLFNRIFGATPHGLINIEFLLIGAIGVFVPRTTVFLLLCAASLADFTYSICYTFQFSLRDMLASLRYLALLPRTTVFAGFALLPAVLLVFAVMARARPRPGMRLWTSVALLALAAVLVPADLILSGRNAAWQVGDVALLPFRLARAPLLALGVREIKTERVYATASGAAVAPMASASDQAIALLAGRAAGAESPNVVLVVVESWGALADPQLARALTAPYSDPRIESKYTASYGAVPFTGLTVPGEARELCHSTLGFGIVHLTADESGRCLPAFLHARGYRNVAIHGYVGQMFSRAAWYPKIGFDETWFGPDLKKAGLPNCVGAFPGVCDQSIAGWMGSSLLSQDRSQPMFLYWVTLNSHVPEPAHPSIPDDGVCATQPALRSSAGLCSWFRIVRGVHQSIQQVAIQQAALGVNFRPTVFILVGDHAPPFGNAALAAQFSPTQVPYVMLTPKDLARR